MAKKTEQAVVIKPTKPLSGVQLANVKTRLAYIERLLGVKFDLQMRDDE